MPESYLQSLVIHRCKELGLEKAGEFFAVSPSLVRQWLAGSKTPSLAAVEKVFTLPSAPPTDASWGSREVFLALPFYKTTSPRTLWSILGVWDRAKFRAGTRFDDAYIIHAREKLADDYITAGVPWIWWVSDDQVFPNGSAYWYNQYAEIEVPERYAGLNTPVQLRSHNKSIVSALYFGRHRKGRAVYAEALEDTPAGSEENRKAHQAPFDEIRPTRWAGMDCMIHRREVLLDIKAKFPFLEAKTSGQPFHFFSNSSDPLLLAIPELKLKLDAAAEQVRGGTGDAALRLLADAYKQIISAENETKDSLDLRQGEDQTFGQRAAHAGHTTFIDFSVVCGHVGTKVYNSQNTES